MKTQFRVLLIILLCSLLFVACASTTFGDANIQAPDPVGLFKLICAAIIALYELIVRIVPTVGNMSVIHWIIEILIKFSGALNVKK